MVRDIVVERHGEIGEQAADIARATRARLRDIVDTELAKLHERNALRFGSRRSQLEPWMRRTEA